MPQVPHHTAKTKCKRAKHWVVECAKSFATNTSYNGVVHRNCEIQRPTNLPTCFVLCQTSPQDKCHCNYNWIWQVGQKANKPTLFLGGSLLAIFHHNYSVVSHYFHCNHIGWLCGGCFLHYFCVANKLVQRYFVQFGDGNEIVGVGQCFATLPLGNGLTRYAKFVGKFLLRDTFVLA